MTARRSRRAGPPPLPPPEGLEVAALTYKGAPALVLSFPLHPPRWPGSLTPAEREVATLLLDGASNAAIAAQRGTSERTVANQIAAIFRKAGVTSRLELAAAIFRA